MTDFAPNWDQNQVLTWSGKWHIIHTALDTADGYARTLCGASGYKRDYVPRYVVRLKSIASGIVSAPVCKKCARAADAAEGEAK